MVNCNPETVSTDYDTSDRLYFEPLGIEEVLAVLRARAAGGRRHPVRRPDAAEARARDRARRLRDPGHAVRRRRPRRGSQRFARARRRLGCSARRGGWPRPPTRPSRWPERDRLPGARPALVRPRWSRDARLLRRPAASREAIARGRRARPGRPLPRGRHRARRRRGLRRPRDVRRCGHAARRGGRCALRRLRLRPARPVARRPQAADVDAFVRALGPALGVVGLVNVQLAIAVARSTCSRRTRGRRARCRS